MFCEDERDAKKQFKRTKMEIQFGAIEILYVQLKTFTDFLTIDCIYSVCNTFDR